MRWRIALLLSLAIAISYLDRQALSIAVAAIQREIPLTNTDFSRLQIAFLARYCVSSMARGSARHATRAEPSSVPTTITKAMGSIGNSSEYRG